MTESFEQLDPNYVIAFEYTPDHLTQLLTELGAKGLHVLPRPGYDKNTVYAFTRVEDRDIYGDVKINGKKSIESSEETGDEILHRICKPLEFVKSITRIHDYETRKKLDKTSSALIGKPIGLPSDQELIQLQRLTKNPRQALYFTFFKTYITWLVPLSAAGVLSKLVHPSTPWEFNIPYTAFLAVWSVLFASSWVYRFEPYYSSKFGKVQNFSETSEKDLSSASAVLGKKLCFLPVALLFVSSLVSFQFFCFFIEIFITQFYAGPLGSVMALLPTVLICSFIPILTIVYNKIFVDRLVVWENGPDPIRSKTEKNFILTFFTSYVPLLITLFIYLPLGYRITPELRAIIAGWCYKLHIPIGKNDFMIDINRYRNQFFYFTVTNQVIAFSMENFLPLVQGKLTSFIMSKMKKETHESGSVIVSTVKAYFPRELSVWQKVNSYHVSDFGEFNVDDNFRKVIIQFGYLSMFSTIWPLAPLVCLLFSYVMLKADLWRALKKCRPSTSPNDMMVTENNYNATSVSADPWDSVLSIISWISATVGPTLLIMYRYSGLPGVGLENALSKRDMWYRYSPLPYSWSTILLIAVALEHLAVSSFVYFRKFFIASDRKFARGYVPATDIQEPPQIDLSSIVKQTNSFMSKISDRTSVPKVDSYESRTNNKEIGEIKKSPSNILEVEKSQSSTDLPSKGTSSTAQERVPVTVESPVVITEAENTKEIIPVPQPKSVPHVAPKTASASVGATAGTNSREHRAIEDGHSSVSSSVEEEQGKSIPSQSKSNLESGSIAAGATLPATIPTSKNYHLRYDSDGKPVASSGSTGNSESSLPNPHPVVQKTVQGKTEPEAGISNGVADSSKERRQINDIEPQMTTANEVRSLDPAKALNTISHKTKNDHLIPTTILKESDPSLAANAAAAALSNHSRTSSQTNAVQQFGRYAPTSIASTKATNTPSTDNRRVSVDRSSSLKSKGAPSSHTQQSGASSRPLENNQTRKSVEHKAKENVRVPKDNKGKHKKNLLQKLKKKL